MKIKNVVVIGSGTMGSGIAAHLCNANVPVTLLDLKTEISEKAREKIHKSRPPLLIDKSKINNIKVGNISDDFDVVKDADWIVEAVVERIDIKHQIYEKIFKARKDGAIVSSNTSSIPIKVLSEHLTDLEKKDFCITHFFNPVRYMGLLEIVKNENNDLNKINQLKEFCETELGKGAIVCNDTPGFLGNRVGVYAMQVAMTEAFKMKLSVEEADAIFGRPMGIPKTGVFGLYDLIGIDLMADVLKSFIKELPDTDEFHEVAKEIPLVKKLIETGYTGRKGKGGFYRMNKSGATKVMEAIDLESGDYSPSKKIDIKSDTAIDPSGNMEEIYLKDNVFINRKYLLDDISMKMYTSYAIFYVSKNLFETDRDVTIITSDSTTTGSGLSANMDTGIIRILSNVKRVIRDNDKSRIIEGNQMIYDANKEKWIVKDVAANDLKKIREVLTGTLINYK